jgi:hypothetical protein
MARYDNSMAAPTTASLQHVKSVGNQVGTIYRIRERKNNFTYFLYFSDPDHWPYETSHQKPLIRLIQCHYPANSELLQLQNVAEEWNNTKKNMLKQPPREKINQRK